MMQFKFSEGAELRKHWMLEEDMHFLNHGSFGATPRVVLQAQQRFRDRLELQPVDFLVRQAPAELRAAAGELRGGRSVERGKDRLHPRRVDRSFEPGGEIELN